MTHLRITMLAFLFLMPAAAFAQELCGPPTPSWIAIIWAGARSGCTSGNAIPCLAGEPIQFAPLAMPGGFQFNYCVHQFTWNFADGSPLSSDFSPVHKFAVAGTFTVNVTVANGAGAGTMLTSVNVAGRRSTRARAVRAGH